MSETRLRGTALKGEVGYEGETHRSALKPVVECSGQAEFALDGEASPAGGRLGSRC